MMKMLKLLRLMVFVVCIAAFASGCGGGGGGGAATPDGAADSGGTTDACRADRCGEDSRGERNTRNHPHGRWQSGAGGEFGGGGGAVPRGRHGGADSERARSSRNALTALTLIEGIVSGAANPAITLAQAQMAVTNAQAALATLTAAQSAAAGIQSAVEAVASQRQQMQADVIELTNGSSLIQHVRANKLLSDALLEDLVADRLLVSGVGSDDAYY